MASPILQFKRGAFTNLPALRVGEPALTTDSFDLYVGIDSTTPNNKFFGSHRYWTRETSSVGSSVNIVEGTTNGSNYIALKSPDTLAGNLTYTLPGIPGASSSTLTNDGSGNLTWSSGSANATFTGITTFSDTTDSATYNDGAVQIKGGLGVVKNLNVGANLNVTGVSTFVGNVTFQGGTINIGDSNTDNINVGGEFISNLTPNVDNTYDIGIGTQRWRSANFSGISTFNNVVVGGATTALVVNGGADISGGETTLSSATISDLTAGRVVLAGTSGSLEDSANLTFSAGGLVVGAGGINVTGVSTFSTDLVVGGNLQVTGNNIKSSTGANVFTLATNNATVANDLTVSGNLYVNGSTTQVNTAALTVEDRTIDLGIVNGAAPASSTTWDLGILFNYYATTAKKSAVIQEHSDTRFKFASVLASDTDGSTVDTPQLTVTTFAPIEIGGLWVNNTCTGGSTEVISCFSGSQLEIRNVVIDAGTF